jgi:hypothetical protein
VCACACVCVCVCVCVYLLFMYIHTYTHKKVEEHVYDTPAGKSAVCVQKESSIGITDLIEPENLQQALTLSLVTTILLPGLLCALLHLPAACCCRVLVAYLSCPQDASVFVLLYQ